MNKYIDHTLLKPDCLIKDINKLIKEAITYNFKSVCVNPYYVKHCKKKLKDTDILVCTVIGFPLGNQTLKTKIFEAKDAIKNGADEIDMVMNISAFKNKKYDYVLDEINKIKDSINNKILKVIVETSYLTNEEIILVSEIILKSNADFIKTSTGFSSRGASLEDIKLMKSVLKDKKLIKASGGIKTKEDFYSLIASGVNRIGTSNGVNLILNKEIKNNY